MKKQFLPFLPLGIVALLFQLAQGVTNQQDATALQVLYTSLNSPSQLHLWSSNGTDPCGQSWQGVQCSGPAVTEINLSGLGLTGGLGYALQQLSSLKVFDLSNNHIAGSLPYQLPPNLLKLNLASNSFSGALPYSISKMTNLTNLSVSNNQLSGALSDVFGMLYNLSSLDLSFNTISGSLPASFSALSSLSTLHLQNNRISGSLNVLANLPLKDLNVENNQFTGWVPATFSKIPLLKDSGNNFNTSPAPPPPPYTPPPPLRKPSGNPSSNSGNESPSGNSSKTTSSKGLNGGAIAGIAIAGILGVIVVILVIVYFTWKTRDVPDEEKQQSSAAMLGPIVPPVIKAVKEEPEAKSKLSPLEVTLKPPPSERYKAVGEKSIGRKASGKRAKSPIAATTYSVADLQLATDSFSQDNLIGEGTFGRVYRAELPNGKLLAIKKIECSSSYSVQRDEEFVEVVSNISRLRHANIAELVGFCSEHGQRLLAYDYFGKGTLHDILHSDDETSKRDLIWNVRVKIALGTARALEYLHEVCSPVVVHKNFKSANILLDDELNPHLSDCGIAAFSPSPEHQVSAQMGSFGYSAPEYAMSGIYTVKSDVYSFGVVMLELLTGRKPLDSARPRAEQSLVRWATPQLHDIDALSKMVDPALKGMYPAKSLSRFADIIASCVQPEPEFRPPMSEVVQSLVRLMQRATPNKRRSGEEQRSSENHDPSDSST